jgi:hypothetical protein
VDGILRFTQDDSTAVESLYRIRKQSHCPRSLDGSSDHSLMLGAISGSAGRNDLGVGVHEAAQKLGVFVIDGMDIVSAKKTSFRRGRRSVLLGVEFHSHNRILCKNAVYIG